jgi:hypothetical protein
VGRWQGQGQEQDQGQDQGQGQGQGRGQGQDQGQGQGQGRGQGNNCADLQDLELKRGREGTLQHGPGAILEGAIGSCRDPTSLG